MVKKSDGKHSNNEEAEVARQQNRQLPKEVRNGLCG